MGFGRAKKLFRFWCERTFRKILQNVRRNIKHFVEGLVKGKNVKKLKIDDDPQQDNTLFPQ